MKRTVLTSMLLCLGLLVLAACSTGGGGPQLPERTDLEANGETDAAYTGSTVLGQTDHFALDLGSVEGELVVVELDADLTLEQTTVTGSTVSIVSNGPDFFAAQGVTVSGAASSTEGLDPAAIGVDPAPCRGSCIVLPADNDTYYFQVSGAVVPTTYSVYVYGAPFVDLNEPANDSEIMTPPYFLGEEDSGAIETIGDVDWWIVGSADSSGAPIEFLATGELDLELFVRDIEGERGPYPSATVVQVMPGDMLRVESATDRAARGAAGYYYFSPVEVVELAPEDGAGTN